MAGLDCAAPAVASGSFQSPPSQLPLPRGDGPLATVGAQAAHSTAWRQKLVLWPSFPALSWPAVVLTRASEDRCVPGRCASLAGSEQVFTSAGVGSAAFPQGGPEGQAWGTRAWRLHWAQLRERLAVAPLALDPRAYTMGWDQYSKRLCLGTT